MNHKKTKRIKGFTLIEVLVSLFVFTLAMTMISGTFASFFKTFRVVRAQQKALEQSNEAMNIMTKVIRTSTVVNMATSGDTQQLKVYDHSQSTSACIVYSYVSGALKMGVGASTSINDCKNEIVTPTSTLVENMGSGGYVNFRVLLPTASSAGRVTISSLVDVQDAGLMAVQSTVSLRNWTKLPT